MAAWREDGGNACPAAGKMPRSWSFSERGQGGLFYCSLWDKIPILSCYDKDQWDEVLSLVIDFRGREIDWRHWFSGFPTRLESCPTRRGMAMDRERIRRRQLPHWDMPGAPYFVTTCLQGSIAARGLLELAHFRAELRQHPKPENVTPDNWNTLCWKRVFIRLEDWLDGQPAVRVLEIPDLA